MSQTKLWLERWNFHRPSKTRFLIFTLEQQRTQVSDVALEGDPVVDLDLVLPGNAAEVGADSADAVISPLLFRPLPSGIGGR